MTKKIDDMLKAALDKAIKKRQAKEKKALGAKQEESDEHNRFIKKWMPKARLWIKEKLFDQITEAEANGKHFVLLGRYESGVPSEVIFEAAKKIKGLHPVIKDSPDYKDIDGINPIQGKGKIITYSIEWDSTDPNDHRNDR